MSIHRTTYFLMANLGSELVRFFALQKQKDTKNAKLSAARAFHIIEQLLKQKNIGNGKQEISILKKLINDSLSHSQKYTVTEEDLNNYFTPFASRALLA